MWTTRLALLLLAFCFMGLSSVLAQSSGYHIIDSLSLGGEGGWDYLTVDTAAERLYISRGMRVQVVDLTMLSIIGEIPNTPGVHGIAIVPALDRGYTSNGRDSSVTSFDTKTLRTIGVLKVMGRNPDAIIFDAQTQRVFTFNGGSANCTAIDVTTDSVLEVIPLPGKPEFSVSDNRGLIYVNIEDQSAVAEINARTLKVRRTWSIAPGEEPSGLAIDREHGFLFSACDNKLMAISDIRTGKVVRAVPIGGGVDGAVYDPERHLAFTSNGEGTLTVVKQSSPAIFTVLETAMTRRGARTVAFDEKTHRLYTVAAKFGPPPPPTADQPHPRPTLVSGSQTLYVIGRE